MESSGKFSTEERDFLDIEALAEEIRQHVNQKFPLEARKAGPSQPPSPDFAPLEPVHTSVSPGAVELPDLGRLRLEVANARMLRDRFGTVNPRPPGFHNRLIQLVKKTMVRALGWYMRPLHEFNAAVARSLSETVRVLEKQKLQMASMHAEIGQLRKALEQTPQNYGPMQGQTPNDRQ